jgi:hypothetical protein
MLTPSESLVFSSAKRKVTTWAREYAANDFNYGSPQSYWKSALAQGVCSEFEYELAEKYYGHMFGYRGD